MATPKKYQNLSYFDQFKDMEIDLSEYLTKLSSDEYKYEFSNIQPATCTVKNLFEQFRIIDQYKKSAAAFLRYSIKDGERLDNISYRFYETVDFWWLIALFNDIRNPFYDLPLNEQQIIELSEKLAEEEGKYPQKTYYKLIFEANETKRQIYIPRPGYVADIVWEFRKAIMAGK